MKLVFFIVLAIAIVWGIYSLILVRRLSSLAKEKQIQEATFWNNQRMPYIDEHLDSLVWDGDTIAYHKLKLYMHNEPTTMQMGYSIIMSVKYEYPPACYDFYNDLVNIYNRMGMGLENMDACSKDLALLYLKKAAAEGEPRAIIEVRRLGLK